MIDIYETCNEDWKMALRSELISATAGTSNDIAATYQNIGQYYMCSAPATLYKYYGDSLRDLETVKNNRMWYSAPCDFNDVFDCDIAIYDEDIFNNLLQAFPDVKNVRIGSAMWKAMRSEIFPQIHNFKSTLKTQKTQTGVSCLSESDDSLLMWAHYANNHCGMCVEYDLLEINRKLQFTPVPVIYANNRVSVRKIDLENLHSYVTSILVESYTSKSPEWSYEKEWRIIRDNAACGDRWNSEKRGALLDMVQPCSVTLGCMAKQEFEKHVHDYCEEYKIPLYKMEKDQTLYRLKKSPILQFDT